MTGPGPDWVHLREFIETVMEERDRQYDLRYRAQEQALQMARGEMERRLEGLNELRREVLEDRVRYLTVEKYDAQYQAVEDSLDELQAFRGRVLGLMATTAIVAGIVGAAVSAVVAHLIS